MSLMAGSFFNSNVGLWGWWSFESGHLGTMWASCAGSLACIGPCRVRHPPDYSTRVTLRAMGHSYTCLRFACFFLVDSHRIPWQYFGETRFFFRFLTCCWTPSEAVDVVLSVPLQSLRALPPASTEPSALTGACLLVRTWSYLMLF